MAEKKPSGWAAYNARIKAEKEAAAKSDRAPSRDADDKAVRYATKKGKRSAKKWIKNMHPATKVIAVLCLVLGIAMGALFCLSAYANDHFTLKGETQFSLTVGDAPYVYTEQGVDAVCFGRDVSDKLTVTPGEGVTDNHNGTYTIPTDKEGVYTITYTVDCAKFGEKAPNGVIKRIRVFMVDTAEADGRADLVTEEGNANGT